MNNETITYKKYETYTEDNGQKIKLVVKFSLGDPCNNGHEDFSVTGDGYLYFKNGVKHEPIYSGCCHDEIEKYCPEIAKYIPLHLCDFNGIPMHVIENTAYHASRGLATTVQKMLRFINFDQAIEICKLSKNDYEFAKLVVAGFIDKLGLVKQWKSEARKAIDFLEEKIETTFQPKNEGHRIDVQRAWYYLNTFDLSEEGILKRKQARIKKKKENAFDKAEKEYEKEIRNAERKYVLNQSLIRIGGTTENVITYDSKKEIVINWSFRNNSVTHSIYPVWPKETKELLKKHLLSFGSLEDFTIVYIEPPETQEIQYIEIET